MDGCSRKLVKKRMWNHVTPEIPRDYNNPVSGSPIAHTHPTDLTATESRAAVCTVALEIREINVVGPENCSMLRFVTRLKLHMGTLLQRITIPLTAQSPIDPRQKVCYT